MGVKVREKEKDSGEWWVFINHKGKRASKKIGSRKAAKEAAATIEREIALERFNLGTMKEEKYATFREYAEKWIEQHVQMTCKPSSADTHRRILDNHLLNEFGDSTLPGITRERLRTYCTKKKEEGYAQATIALHLSCISGVMDLAVEDKVIDVSPCTKIKKYAKGGKPKRAVDFLTGLETAHFLDIAKEHFPRYYPVFLTALRTGMRIGELKALRWDDVDFKGKFIEVRHTLWGRHLQTPKNGKVRRVDMSDQLTIVLTEHRRKIKEESLKSGREFPGWIFTNGEGKHLWGNTARGILGRVTKKAGMRTIGFHTFRHTYASLLIGIGESLPYIQNQLGHASIKMTVDVYGHLIPGANRQAVNRLDDPSWGDKFGKTAPQAHPAPEKPLELNTISKSPIMALVRSE